MAAKKTTPNPNETSAEAIAKADRVEEGPSDPFDMFASDQFANDDSQEAKNDRKEEQLDAIVDAIDFGEFADLEVVDDSEESKSKNDEEDSEDDEEEEEDEEGTDDADEDEEDEEDEDEEQEDEEDEEESEEETELVKNLKATLAAQDTAMQNLQAQMQELLKKKETPEPKTEPEDDGKPVFNIGVPREVVSAFASGEPDQIEKAVQIITNGTAEIVRRQVLKEGREVLKAALEEERGKVNEERTMKEEQDAIHKDFYGTYPGYATPEIQRLVASVATQYVARTPGATWGPMMKKAVADSVAEIVKFDGKADPAKASRKRGRKTSAKKITDGKDKKGKKKKSAGSRPPRQIKAGTRVAEAVKSRKDRQEDIAETFAGFRG